MTWKNPCPHSLRGGSCLQRESTGVVFIDNTLPLFSSICVSTNGACRIPCPLFSSICVSTNGACCFPCHIVSTASTALSGSSAQRDIKALNLSSCYSAYLDFLRKVLSQLVSSSTPLIIGKTLALISLSSTRGPICVNTNGACRIPCPLFSSICVSTNEACRFPCSLFSSICVSTNGACRFPCPLFSP